MMDDERSRGTKVNTYDRTAFDVLPELLASSLLPTSDGQSMIGPIGVFNVTFNL